jgi:hypothetical protein
MSIATEIRLRIKAEGEGVLKGLSGKAARYCKWYTSF